MNEISTVVKPQLPAKIEDLTRFVLIGREKLISVRAEIRAIEKLELASEVREQKKDEAQMLAEALLDAEMRIGELIKQIPTARGLNKNNRSVQQCTEQKTKEEIIKDLGFEHTQAVRFEVLASNPDIVEQVKQEARENDDLPTRTEVLRRVAERKAEERKANSPFANDPVIEQIGFENKTQQYVFKTIEAVNGMGDDIEHLEAWLSDMSREDIRYQIIYIDTAIDKLHLIKSYAQERLSEKPKMIRGGGENNEDTY